MAKKKGKVKINHKYCKTCSICVSFCPVKNLEIRENKLIELGKCIACRTCETYCPDIAITIEELHVKTTLAGKPGNRTGG